MWKGKIYRHSIDGGREDRPPPFFILAPGRSGSTLLRRMITQHPEITIPPESGDAIPQAAMSFLGASTRDREMKEEEALRTFFCRSDIRYWDLDPAQIQPWLRDRSPSEKGLIGLYDAIYSTYGRVKEEKRVSHWGDKTPFLLFRMEWLRFLFPNALFIFLVRDGRDVVNSMLKRRGRGLKEACDRWKLGSRIVLKNHHDKRSRSVMLFYEEFVNYPERTLSELFERIGTYVPQDLKAYVDKSEKEYGDTVLEHHRKAKGAVDPENIGLWEKEMKKEERDLVQKELTPALKKLGYRP
ncbi:MAG: sulfotransferase [Flavobacteriales bacterium]